MNNPAKAARNTRELIELLGDVTTRTPVVAAAPGALAGHEAERSSALD
jgi:hypothetical protein